MSLYLQHSILSFIVANVPRSRYLVFKGPQCMLVYDFMSI